MRTQEEIMARIESIKGADFFGFETGDLIEALGWEHALKYIKPEKHEEAKASWGEPSTDDDIKEQIREYIGFAYDKCVGHRGLSAGRSVDHFRAWCWLIGADEIVAFIDAGNYRNYGAPVIKRVAEHFGVELPEHSRTEFERMAKGLACTGKHTCDDGCGL